MNTERETRTKTWQTNLLMTAGVMVTILLALILAQLDALQARAAVIPPGLPIVNIQATAIAVGNIIPLELGSAQPLPVEELADAVPSDGVPFDGVPPDDLNPRPAFITGVSEEGIIFTVCGEVPEGWLLYTVKPGETLASLAAGTETAAADLAAANCLTDGQVTAGMQLLVPREPAQTQCGPPQWWVRYQVQRGDSLGALAVNRGTTIDEILRANCRDSLDLQAGQWIFLPPGAAPGAPPNAPPPVAQPSLTPLPTPTDIPTLAPLPTATTGSEPPPPPTAPSVTLPAPPTASPPPLPTNPPPTLTPQPPPTNPPPPPTEPPPTNPPPTNPPPPTAEPPTVTPQPPPTEPPPTATPVTPPTEPPPEPTQEPPPPPDEGGG